MAGQIPATSHKGLQRPVSDHCPILLGTELPKEGPHPFRSEGMWVRHRNFEENVQIWWSESNIQGWADFAFQQRLKNLKLKLKSWNKETFGQIKQRRGDILKGILQLDVKETDGMSEEERNLRYSLKHELKNYLLGRK